MADIPRSDQRAKAAERRAEVVALRRRRATFDDIGRMLGISRQRAHQLYQQALRDIPALAVAEHLAEELTLIDDACRGLMLIAADRNVSPRTRIEAWAVLCRWAERKARLLGLDAPVKARIEVLDDQAVEEMNRQLEAELAALGGPVPQDWRQP